MTVLRSSVTVYDAGFRQGAAGMMVLASASQFCVFSDVTWALALAQSMDDRSVLPLAATIVTSAVMAAVALLILPGALGARVLAACAVLLVGVVWPFFAINVAIPGGPLLAPLLRPQTLVCIVVVGAWLVIGQRSARLAMLLFGGLALIGIVGFATYHAGLHLRLAMSVDALACGALITAAAAVALSRPEMWNRPSFRQGVAVAAVTVPGLFVSSATTAVSAIGVFETMRLQVLPIIAALSCYMVGVLLAPCSIGRRILVAASGFIMISASVVMLMMVDLLRFVAAGRSVYLLLSDPVALAFIRPSWWTLAAAVGALLLLFPLRPTRSWLCVIALGSAAIAGAFPPLTPAADHIGLLMIVAAAVLGGHGSAAAWSPSGPRELERTTS